MGLVRIDGPLTIIRKGKKYVFHEGDVVQTSQFPNVERLLKEQKRKGHVEKNGKQSNTRHNK